LLDGEAVPPQPIGVAVKGRKDKVAIEVKLGAAFKIAPITHKYDLSSDCLPLTKVDRYVHLKADPPKYIFPAHTCNFFNLPDRLGGKS
jgi:hypothetical protein